MKRNIRLVLLGELVLFIVLFVFNLLICTGDPLASLAYFLDIPSLLLILLILIPGLLIMGEWKNFTKAFSVGIKEYSLLELKNIIQAIKAAQLLTVFAALFAILTSIVIILIKVFDTTLIGPNLAVCLLTGFYAAIIEYFLLPLRLNAEHKMNEEMDFEDE